MKTGLFISRVRHLGCSFLAPALLLACSGSGDRVADPVAPSPPPPAAVVEEPPLPDPPAPAAPAVGMWVLAEGSQRVLEDSARIDPLLQVANQLGVSDLFVQVYRGGRSWYPSQLADPTPFEEAGHAEGVDALALLIQRAHAQGLRVHGWVNVLSLSGRRDAKLLEVLGPEAVLVDSRGRSLLDYPDLEVPEPDRGWYRMGTRGVYLDAGSPGVADKLVEIFVDLVTRYPAMEGLHLDYIRHPGALPMIPGSRFGVGLDFGYGEPSRKRFQQETGLAGPFVDDDDPDPTRLVNQNAWDAWRRQKVTDLVKQIGEATRAVRPGLVLSAAVNSYVDRAYLSLAQDWMQWLEAGYIDLALPMAYTLDDRLLKYQVDHFARSAYADRIWPGLGIWLFAKRPAGALAQIEIAESAGAQGIVLFSYDSIADAPALLAALTAAPLHRTPAAAASPPAAAP